MLVHMNGALLEPELKARFHKQHGFIDPIYLFGPPYLIVVTYLVFSGYLLDVTYVLDAHCLPESP